MTPKAHRTHGDTPIFPQFEKIFDVGQTEPFLRQVERTRLQLTAIATRSADSAERVRATVAFEAYTRALALVKEVDDERRRMATTSTDSVR